MEARCQCGQLTARIEEDTTPMTVLCHCADCQRRSGSPFGVIAYFPKDSVQIAGEAREFTRDTDTGAHFTNGFCPQCGSTVFARAEKYADIVGITLGSLADPAFPPPHRTVYEQSRHGWVTLPDDMPRHPRGRDS